MRGRRIRRGGGEEGEGEEGEEAEGGEEGRATTCLNYELSHSLDQSGDSRAG